MGNKVGNNKGNMALQKLLSHNNVGVIAGAEEPVADGGAMWVDS